MPTLSLNALRKEVKAGKLAPVYYFHGAEETLKDEALGSLVDLAVDPASRDFNYDVRHATSLDPEALHALVNTLPMMAERRVVVIRDVDGWTVKSPTRKVLLEYLADPAPETLLILHQGPPKGDDKDEVDKELAERAQVVNCAALDGEEALAWVVRRAKQLDIPLTAEGAQHLVNATGPELALLKLELEKFAALGATAPIGVETVGEMVGIRYGETQYDWRDAVLRRDVVRATAMLPRILDQSGVSAVGLVALLGSSLITLGVVRGHYDRKLRGGALNKATWDTLKANKGGRLGNWGEFVNLAVEVAADWPQGRIRRGLAALLAADQALKETRLSTDKGILTDLLLQIAARMPAEGAA
ncbi:MAG TPA: DNA polymerase III subunit delta [Gemmatimonadales bacterium]|nr:DNA polymerase III subunit delta [Gemmatimonadales bacterium]